MSNEIISKLDRLRSQYGRALTKYEDALENAGEIAQRNRARELKAAREMLEREERAALAKWRGQ